MGKVTYCAPAEKRTGVYGEEWRESLLGDYQIEVAGVQHEYGLGPEFMGNHAHWRDGVLQDYGRHGHSRWDEPHRHAHPGDARPKAPSHPERTGRAGDLPREERDRPDTHHAHRIYVTEAVTLNDALDALAMAIRMGSAAYEDGRWKDAYQRAVAARDAAEAARTAAEKIVVAMHDLWRDGGPACRVIEFENQVRPRPYGTAA